LAQEATDEKTNEINAIPKLLALLELKGCMVTLDAMGCQRAITEQIKGQQGDDVMGLKGNQSSLPNMEAWAGLRSIGMVERESTQCGTTTVERRFFIASIQADAKLFAKAVRGHWGIENTLRWRLDVTFSEDASRIRKGNGNGPAMMTSIRHLCLNLFEREDSKLKFAQKAKQSRMG